jgi:hypothetical protein
MKRIASLRRYGSGLLLALLLVPLATGCGGKAGATVSGTVTYQGKPLSSGIVTFVPDVGPAHNADIQSDGSYRMTNVPVGPVKISVTTNSPQNRAAPSKMPTSAEGFAKMEASMKGGKESLIPARYTDPNKSQLTYTVKKGKQQFDIELR